MRVYVPLLVVMVPLLFLGCEGPTGPDGAPGGDGAACWDLDANGVADLATEDLNGDGVVSRLDCAGDDGQAGVDGLPCWDINGDGVGEPGTEDTNGDGVVDGADCRGGDGAAGIQGAAGAAGAVGAVGTIGDAGAAGVACWDLNGNGTADVATEDANGDTVVDVLDCVGLACWDLNGNGAGDVLEEDQNGDTFVDVFDCAGMPALDGPGGLPFDPATMNLGDVHDPDSPLYRSNCSFCHGTRENEFALDLTTPRFHTLKLTSEDAGVLGIYGDATGDERCVTCHVRVDSTFSRPFGTLESAAVRELVPVDGVFGGVASGVNCTGCHGGGDLDFFVNSAP